jgi:hypothetical protein
MTHLDAYAAAGWRFLRVFGLVLAALVISTAVMAEDCRPLPTILVEAELRGEEPVDAHEQPDGTVQVLLSTPDREHWTLLVVTEGQDVDRACIIAQSEQGEPS